MGSNQLTPTGALFILLIYVLSVLEMFTKHPVLLLLAIVVSTWVVVKLVGIVKRLLFPVDSKRDSCDNG